MLPTKSGKQISCITQLIASKLDQKLFEFYPVEQLMELAGLSVATAIHDHFKNKENKRNVLVLCGPGNNGGDGLVAARHLSSFNFKPHVYCPKQPNKNHLRRVLSQCNFYDIPVLSELPDINDKAKVYDIIVDSIFGFGFNGIPREPYSIILNKLCKTKIPIVSVDMPSGWPENANEISADHFYPEVLVSLSVPKMCALHFKGTHYLGGRFLPPKIVSDFQLTLPEYIGSDQIIKI